MPCGSSKDNIHDKNSENDHCPFEDLDHSILQQPLNLGIVNVKQILKCVQSGTKEVKDIVLNECNIIYECKVCLNLFRSLANFMYHKRCYCKKHLCEEMLLFEQFHEEETEIVQPESSNNISEKFHEEKPCSEMPECSVSLVKTNIPENVVSLIETKVPETSLDDILNAKEMKDLPNNTNEETTQQEKELPVLVDMSETHGNQCENKRTSEDTKDNQEHPINDDNEENLVKEIIDKNLNDSDVSVETKMEITNEASNLNTESENNVVELQDELNEGKNIDAKECPLENTLMEIIDVPVPNEHNTPKNDSHKAEETFESFLQKVTKNNPQESKNLQEKN